MGEGERRRVKEMALGCVALADLAHLSQMVWVGVGVSLERPLDSVSNDKTLEKEMHSQEERKENLSTELHSYQQ